MPMARVENETLRLRGWSSLRSSSRDYMIPLTGPGRALQRIVMKDVLPVAGVGEGVAISDEERAARAQAQVEIEGRITGAMDQPLGVMQYVHFTVSNVNPGVVLGVPVDSAHVVGTAPYDGWLREIMLDGSLSAATLPSVAIRTSSGGTWFRSFEDGLFPNTTTFVEPDFARLNYAVVADRRVILRGGKVPVFAGDQIIVVVRDVNATGAGLLFVDGYVGIEAVVLARAGSAAGLSQYFALRSQATAAAREGSEIADRLRLEQERSRRAIEVERLKLERDKVQLEAERVAAGALATRVSAVRQAPVAQAAFSSRGPVTVPPFTGPPAPAAPTGGPGNTFVGAYQPANGSVGYLAPTPPPGGRVNVFDGKYTVWDAAGQRVSEGRVTNVGNAADIPAGTRISPNRGGTLSGGFAPSVNVGEF